MRHQMLPLRRATLSDVEDIIPLMKAFKDESAYKDSPTEEEAIRETAITYINKDIKECMVVVAVINDKIEGIIVGTCSKLPFNSQLQAAETIWYVSPEHRKTTIGLALYQSFMYWAINKAGASIVLTGAPKGSKLDKVYKKEGYELLEQLYIKVI